MTIHLVGTGGFATIQEAVDAAVNGDTIVVAAGTYTEQVQVDGLSDLTIMAADGAEVIIKAPAVLVATSVAINNRDVNAVVTVENSSNVVIQGILVDGNGNGNAVVEGAGSGAPGFWGVFYRNSSGGLVDVDITGVRDAYPGGTTAGGHPVVSGAQRGVGLGVENNSLMAFSMTGGTIDDFQKNATKFVGADLDITGVTIIGGGAQTINAQNGFQLNDCTGTISGNTITGFGYAGPTAASSSGILAWGNTDLDITGNIITGANAENDDADFVAITIVDFGVPSSGGEISGNTISQADVGIGVYGDIEPTGILIENNTITDVDVTESYAAGVEFQPSPDDTAAFDVDGSDADDILSGGAGNDSLSGLGGNDLLDGNGGDDNLDGGAGDEDTASYAGNSGDYDITAVTDANGWATSFASVTDTNAGDGDDGADILAGVENLVFANTTLDLDDPVQLFDAGGNIVGTFTTIQAAVNAASDDGSILVAAGTYIEQVQVDGIDGLTITGIGSVTIQAPADLVETARSSSDREIHAVLTVENSTNVVVEGIDINGDGRGNTVDEGGGAGQANFYGVFFRNSSGTLDEVDITGVRDPYPGGLTAGGEPIVSGVQRGVGLVVDNDVLMAFTMTGGSISDFQKNATSFNRADLDISGVTITGGGAQTVIAQNGFQVTNSTGTIAGNTVTGFGYAGPANATATGMLLFGNTDLEVTGNTIAGSNDDNTASDVVGIYVYTTNSGGEITGNDIAHADVGIFVTGTIQPNGILIENNDVTNVDLTESYAAGVEFVPSPALTTAFDVDGSDADDILTGAAGNDSLSGLGGDDQLDGNGGDDDLDGGAGHDTATYAGNISGYNVVAVTNAAGQVIGFDSVTDTNAGNGDEGADDLTSVETLVFADITLDVGDPVQLFDAGDNLIGTFDTIQAAVDAAGSVVGAVTILVGDGNFVENVIIDRGDLTLISANGRDATTITGVAGGALGAIELDPGVNNVTIGGEDHGFTIVGLNGNGAIENGAIYLQGAHDNVDILGNDVVANGDAGLMSEFGQSLTNITIDGNIFSGQTFSGAQPGGSGFGEQFNAGNNVPRQLVVLGSGNGGDIGSNVVFTNNQVTGTAGGISSTTSNPFGNSLVTIDVPGSTISGNTFSGYTTGTGFALRARSSDTDVTNNVIEGDAASSRGIFVNNDGVPGTYSGNSLTGDTAGIVVQSMTEGADTVTGTDQVDIIATNGGGDTIDALDGNDTIVGGTGGDDIDGGDGTDTSVHAGNLSGYSLGVTTDGLGRVTAFTSVTETSSSDTDTLTSVEKLQFDNVTLDLTDPVQLLDAGNNLVGTFDTIQAAIDAGQDDYTVLVAAGTYAETLSVNKDVTILGPNAGTPGTDTRAAEAVIDGIIHITAAGATFDGLTVQGGATVPGTGAAIYVNADDVTLTNLILQGEGADFAITTPYAGNVTGLVLSDSFVTGWAAGAYFNPSTQFSATGNSFDDNGNGFVGDDWGVGTIISDNSFTNSVGSHIGYGSFDTVEDIAVFFGPGNTFGGTNRAVSVFTYGDGDAGGQVIYGTEYADGFNGSEFVAGSDDDNEFHGRGGDDRLRGNSGNDTLDGGTGDDVLIGGTETDTATYVDAIGPEDLATVADADPFTVGNQAGWTVTTSTEGTDSLTGVEIVSSASGNILLVGSGGFATIQEAIDAASDGDIIMVAAGTYDEDLVIDVGVTILGAQAGNAVGGRDAATGVGETTILGDAEVTASSGVTLDGLRFLNNATTTGGGGTSPTLQFLSAGHTVTNSIFWSDVAGGAVDDRAIMVNPILGGTLTITDNLISGASEGLFSTASWGRGIWFDGGGVALVFSGNTIEWARTGLNLDMSGGSTANLSGNWLQNLGTLVSVGIDSDGIAFSGNTVSNVGTEFNYRNLTGDTVLDAGAAIGTLVPVGNPNDLVVVLGGSGNDTLTGTSGDDVIDGNNHPTLGATADNDVLDGGGGTDQLFGRFGDDTLDGGTGNDVLDGGGDDDTLTGGAGTDVLTGGDGSDTLDGGANGDTLDGGNGDDTMTGGSGNDVMDGGAGVDTAVVGDGPILIDTALGWLSVSSSGNDVLEDVEIVVDADGNRTLLVGSGGFTTIQEAIDAASDGDTILVVAGTYDEDLNIHVGVTIVGAQAGEPVGGRDAETGVGEVTIVGHAEVTASAGVTLDGLRFLNDATTTGGGGTNPTLQFLTGGHTVTNTIFWSDVAGGAVDDRAIMVNPILGGTLTITDNLISGASEGQFSTASWGRGIWFDGGGVALVVSGNTIEWSRTGLNLDMGGTSTANLSDNLLQNLGTMVSVGIDADGISLTGNTVSNVGTEFNYRNLTGDAVLDAGVAIGTLVPVGDSDDLVVVLGGSGNDTLTGTSGDDVIDGNNHPTLGATADNDVLDGAGGTDLLFGRFGNDALEGGDGTDFLSGGSGIDTAVFTDSIGVDDLATVADADPFTVGNQAGWTVTSATEGTDTLLGVEIVSSASGNILLVGSGGFATIQEAIDAASDGDTILVAAGTYDEDLVIDVGVTILSAEAGNAVGGRDAETGVGEVTIVGHAEVTASSSVTLDGLRFLNDATTTGGGGTNPTLQFLTGGHTVTNTIFWSDVAGGAVDDRAIMVNPILGGTLTITDNLISGASEGQFSTASWGRGIWFDGGGVALVVSGNTIEWSRTGLNLDMSGSSTANLSANLLQNLGTMISVGIDADGITYSGNTVSNVGTEFNYRNLTGDAVLDAGAAIGTLVPVGDPDDLVVVLGGSGNDTLTGTSGDDVIDGNNHPTLGATADNDVLAGADGDDMLFGRAGNDWLDGGADDDTLEGGAGNDTYVVGEVGDSVVEASGAGIDLVRSSITYTLAAELENLTLTGTDAINGTGNGVANIIIGNVAANVIDAGAGNDLIDGGGGADEMSGGSGDDIYVVDDSGDLSIETGAADGTDLVRSSVDYTLGAFVENLSLTGTAEIDGTGNSQANRITGNIAANVLDGGEGADRLVGGKGDDTYYFDHVDDKAVEKAGNGIDTVYSSVGLSMNASVENVTLTGAAAINATGNGLDNLMIGNGAANELNGFTGADEMRGGDGDDTYTIDNVGDLVVENEDEGIDTIISRNSLTLGANVENLTLIGTASIGTGNGLANVLVGNALSNTLNGAGGADEMRGGGGNDVYVVDSAGDTAVEGFNNGTDRVDSSVSFALGAFVENLTLTGSGNINATGNGQDNTLVGNIGNNTLSGGTGADEMRGGAGDDTYFVDNVGDLVIEGGNNGTDTVNSSVSFTLSIGVDNLVLTGGGAISGTGNNAANTITGNNVSNTLAGGNGNDTLSGGLGKDKLYGGAGSDTLEGGTAADQFLFDTTLNAANNVDHILDFTHGTDLIVLDDSVFSALSAGSPSASVFATGIAAGDADDRIIYDAATGSLYYDSDGTGAAAAVLFAVLDNQPATITASDFLVI